MRFASTLLRKSLISTSNAGLISASYSALNPISPWFAESKRYLSCIYKFKVSLYSSNSSSSITFCFFTVIAAAFPVEAIYVGFNSLSSSISLPAYYGVTRHLAGCSPVTLCCIPSTTRVVYMKPSASADVLNLMS